MPFITAVAFLAVVTAVTCALPGTFLVLRHQSMLVEAMSHAVLPGIVIGAIISGTTHSPVMVVTASIMGLVVVLGAEQLRASRLLTGDADQGLIFPFLFAIGVLLMSTTLSQVHIDENTVLTGDLNLMALRPEHILLAGGTIDIGPQTVWRLLGVMALTTIYVVATYPVLKLATFDSTTARTLGLPVKRVDLGLMMLVSLTVVVGFDAAGAILVVALMVIPPATALLLARSLPQMIMLSLVLAAASALLGFWVALQLDLATSSTMAVVDALVLLVVLTATRRRRRPVEALNAPGGAMTPDNPSHEITASDQPRGAVPLSSVRRGTRARIVSVSEERGLPLAHRLVDLGLEPGREVTVGRRAPLADPTIYRVADYSVSLRRRDAQLVLVELLEPSA